MEMVVGKLIEALGPVVTGVVGMALAAVLFAGARKGVGVLKGLASKTENKVDDQLVDGLEDAVEEAEDTVVKKLPPIKR